MSRLRDRQVGHGRTESRSIKVLHLDGTPEAAAVPAQRPGDQGGGRRRCAGEAKPSVQTVYAITSLGHRHADVRLLAGSVHSHWTNAPSDMEPPAWLGAGLRGPPAWAPRRPGSPTARPTS